MKVLIMSDSHGLTEEMANIKERHQYDVQRMIHCGDSELAFNDLQMKNFLAVGGNCDYDAAYPDDQIEMIGNKRFFITHGHLHNVKMTLLNLSYKAEEADASVICFGHTHLAGSEMINGRLFINPGSIRLPRGRAEKTYVILEGNSKEMTVTFYDIDGMVVKELTKTYHVR
jgi:uncharacterized protein